MFPNLYIGDYILPMTGLWLMISVIVFMLIFYLDSRKIWFSFWKLFFAMPYMIWLPYVLGRYVDMMLQFHIIIPYNKTQILSLFSSYGYNFHYIWVAAWIFLAFVIFIGNNYKYRRDLMWILFDALMQSMIVLWIFWVLWDDFVWRPNDGIFSIWSIATVSKINTVGKVYPVGIIMSFVAMITYIITIYLRNKKKDPWYILLWFGLFALLMNFVFYYQSYIRHWVIVSNIDIKNYFTTILWLYILYRFFKYKNENRQKLLGQK